MGHRQKGKSMKRKRSWHRRGPGPDRAWQRAAARIDKALNPHDVLEGPSR